MRRTLLVPRPDRFVGLLCALTHVWYVSSALRLDYESSYAGYDDPFDFHGFIWFIDPPLDLVADLILSPLGIGYRHGDIWSYVVTDMILLVSGTVYWLAVGFFGMRVLIPAIGVFWNALEKIGLDWLKTLRILLLLIILVALMGRVTNLETWVRQFFFILLVFALPLLATLRALFELARVCWHLTTRLTSSPPPSGEGGPTCRTG